jgi:hypothetical protein
MAPDFLSVPVSGRATRVDWLRAAQLLRRGHTIAEVAKKMRCSRQHVWRIKRLIQPSAASTVTGDWLDLDPRERLERLGPAVAAALARGLDDGNVRVALWLAERLGLGTERRSRGAYGRHAAARDEVDDRVASPASGEPILSEAEIVAQVNQWLAEDLSPRSGDKGDI